MPGTLPHQEDTRLNEQAEMSNGFSTCISLRIEAVNPNTTQTSDPFPIWDGRISSGINTMKFLHISDLHMVPGNALLYGLNPQERLRACVAHINLHHPDAKCAIVTGDLTQNGHPDAYKLVKLILSELTMPCHLMVGNHDDRNNFRAAFRDAPLDPNGFVQFTLETKAGLLHLH